MMAAGEAMNNAYKVAYSARLQVENLPRSEKQALDRLFSERAAVAGRA